MSSFYLLRVSWDCLVSPANIFANMHKNWHSLCSYLVCLYHEVIWTIWTLTKFSLLLQYVIGRSDDDSKPSILVKILDKLTQTWYCTSPFHLYDCTILYFFVAIQSYHWYYGRVVPTVLGTQPTLTESQSTIPVNDEKILIIENGVPLKESIWFLEVYTENWYTIFLVQFSHRI